MTDPDQACGRAPNCGNDYLDRISGPLMDRFDLRIEVPVVRFQDLSLPASGERSHVIATRVLAARTLQDTRYAKTYLELAAIKLNLTARGFHRVIRVARTITDLEQSEHVARHHVGEAISFHNSAPAA
jgi:magnesium chelatase family protein